MARFFGQFMLILNIKLVFGNHQQNLPTRFSTVSKIPRRLKFGMYEPSKTSKLKTRDKVIKVT